MGNMCVAMHVLFLGGATLIKRDSYVMRCAKKRKGTLDFKHKNSTTKHPRGLWILFGDCYCRHCHPTLRQALEILFTA